MQEKEIGKIKGPAIRDALNRYRAFLASEYGEEKLARMEHFLKINLLEMAIKNEPLTPEIVYRFNVATSLIEIQSVRALWTTLQKISEKPKSEKLMPAIAAQLPLFEQRGLVQLLGKKAEDLTIEDLKKWSAEAKKSGREIDRTMEIYKMDAVDRDRMYSGRKIFEPITTDYTTADYGERKVHVDLQELSQIVEEHEYDENRPISEEQKEAAFYERLMHIVAKKELVIAHPTQEMSVGMMIPGRPHPDGSRQWYSVTGCTRTLYGKCSYTLEPTSTKSTLPPILLHRSTFTNEDVSSVRNDFNPLSGPGYEGFSLAAKYENNFVKNYTIPAWVGYAHWAAKDLTHDHAKERLEKATEQLIWTLKKPYLPKTYRQLIRANDYLLLDLFYNGICSLTLSIAEQKKLCEWTYNFFTKERDDSENRANAKFLASLLDQFPSEKNKTLAAELRAFAENKVTQDASVVDKLPIVQKLRELQEKAKTDESAIEEWSDLLTAHAKSLGEHPSQKQATDFAIAGHSLGGALTQISMVKYTSDEERIPLKTMQGHIADAPGILDDDCEALFNYGNRHCEMMVAIGSKLELTNSQEKGDPTVLSGERHVGSVKTEEEQKLQARWFSVKNKLYDVKEDAKTPALRENLRHGTRFETRRDESEVEVEAISPVEQYQFKMAHNLEAWEPFQKRWKFFPGMSISRMTPKQFEELRVQVGTVIRALRPFVQNPTALSRFQKNSDINGVFAIGVDGILSR